MKHLLSLILIILILVLPTGCNTTRKASKSTISEQITEQTATTTETATLSKEAVNTQNTLNESLNAEIDFIRYEFTDGTTLDDVTPFISNNAVKPRAREETEPPNPGKGIKNITTGHINLNKQTEQETETQATADTEQTTSQKSENNKNSKVSQQSTSTEKEKRGFIYYIGVLTITLITSGLIYLIVRFIRRKKRGVD
ncbi:MAG: hypothetical protein HDR09_21605 [Lachnospiraceae bacterium]|nr:hypothetical protein [Lachnospiraceae bacterium]